jgi:uncharacterized protein
LKVKKAAKRPYSRAKFLKLLLLALLFTLIFGYIGISVAGATYFITPRDRNIGLLTPATFGIAYEEVEFASAYQDKLTLRAWWLPNPKSDMAIVVLHGQGGNRSCCIGTSRRLWDNNFSLLMMDLRGHGLSDGTSHSLGLREQWDVIGAVNFLKEKGFKPGKIGLIGWSMGASTAIMAASQTNDIGAVVSDSGYANAATLLRVFYPGTLLVARWLHNIDLEEVKPEIAIANLGRRRVLLIHGDLDKNVPVGDAYKLKAAGGDKVELWVWQDTGHSGAYGKDRATYGERVVSFFRRELS